MGKQLIISVGREFGSGGHVIASKIAKNFELPLLDSNILADIAKEKQTDEKELKKYDESGRNFFLSRTVNGYSNSPEDVIAHMQFDYLKKKADNGESFVVIGRCADWILRDNPNLVKIFVLGDKEAKIQRISEINNISREKAKSFIQQQDKSRKYYHNTHCEGKWGDSRCYDITVNSSKLGIDGTTELLINYINLRNSL